MAKSRVNTEVPSLYVRVYRVTSQRLCLMKRSLTVCEGVSPSSKVWEEWELFPYYM